MSVSSGIELPHFQIAHSLNRYMMGWRRWPWQVCNKFIIAKCSKFEAVDTRYLKKCEYVVKSPSRLISRWSKIEELNFWRDTRARSLRLLPRPRCFGTIVLYSRSVTGPHFLQTITPLFSLTHPFFIIGFFWSISPHFSHKGGNLVFTKSGCELESWQEQRENFLLQS